jgi:hypothetical protein
VLRAIALLLAALLLLPAAALADGDPASDVLLGESVFYPYQPPVKSSIQKALNAEALAAQRAGFPIKVALIASPVDLGVIPDLFEKPQKYADFLDQEISFQARQLLLVVMPSGYGVQGLPQKASAAVATLAKPAGKSSNDLATAALGAIPRLAAAAGHPIKRAPQTTKASSSGNSTSTLLIVLIAAAALIALTLGVLTLRRRRAPV